MIEIFVVKLLDSFIHRQVYAQISDEKPIFRQRLLLIWHLMLVDKQELSPKIDSIFLIVIFSFVFLFHDCKCCKSFRIDFYKIKIIESIKHAFQCQSSECWSFVSKEKKAFSWKNYSFKTCVWKQWKWKHKSFRFFFQQVKIYRKHRRKQIKIESFSNII